MGESIRDHVPDRWYVASSADGTHRLRFFTSEMAHKKAREWDESGLGPCAVTVLPVRDDERIAALESELREARAECEKLRVASEKARDAMDELMGDTDLDEDDGSRAMEAFRELNLVLG